MRRFVVLPARFGPVFALYALLILIVLPLPTLADFMFAPDPDQAPMHVDEYPNAIVAGQFVGDALPDLAACSVYGRSVTIFRNSGGRFAKHQSIT